MANLQNLSHKNNIKQGQKKCFRHKKKKNLNKRWVQSVPTLEK